MAENGGLYAVVGLGNPGREYRATRHNVGFCVVERLAAQESFREEGGCLVARSRVGPVECLLLMPQRFMNRSGEAVTPLVRYFRIPVERVLVVYDDLDLDPGVLKIQRGGSSGGHKGVESMIEALGDSDFIRIRVGIGHPRRSRLGVGGRGTDEGSRVLDVAHWVLGEPGPEEKDLLQASVSKAAEAVIAILVEGVGVAQNRYNRRERNPS